MSMWIQIKILKDVKSHLEGLVWLSVMARGAITDSQTRHPGCDKHSWEYEENILQNGADCMSQRRKGEVEVSLVEVLF